jgi:hypothetical protein
MPNMQKNYCKEIRRRSWWHMPIIPALREAEAEKSPVPGQPRLYSKFKATIEYIGRPSLKKQTERNHAYLGRRENQKILEPGLEESLS